MARIMQQFTSPSGRPPIEQSRLVNRAPVFYGWVILAVGTLGLIMTSPGQTYAVSIFIERFIQDLGLSRSLVSSLYAGGTLAGSLALPFIGREIDRRGSRFMMAFIAGVFGLACIYMGLVQGALMLGIGFVAIRMFGQGSLSLVSQNAINQWWVYRRGAVLGISGLFVSLLALGAFPGLINWLIPRFGWRLTYGLLGGLLLFVMAPLGYLLIRERPERYGLLPDGSPPEENGRRGPRQRSEENWTRDEALRTATFWIVAGALASIAMISTGLFFHMVSIFADSGLDRGVAATVYLPIAATTAVANLSSGALVDRIPPRFALASSLLLQALALWMARDLASVPLAILYGVALGMAMGLYRTISAMAWAHYFGRQYLGSISGIASTILIVGASLGPIPLGFARDALGSYDQALLALTLLPLSLAAPASSSSRRRKETPPRLRRQPKPKRFPKTDTPKPTPSRKQTHQPEPFPGNCPPTTDENKNKSTFHLPFTLIRGTIPLTDHFDRPDRPGRPAP